ncbi:hypothetical protein DPMN_190222 [Dreissena polymorpha]|uniref:Uncharacterized protein n=1 Tax=Dreissena polymorpha TaxID=45954 RepID=A0A9D4DU92_DREPO|nr:hypothetical protein DPMN_190222 [Dreissena polymorpha]
MNWIVPAPMQRVTVTTVAPSAEADPFEPASAVIVFTYPQDVALVSVSPVATFSAQVEESTVRSVEGASKINVVNIE